MRIKKLTLLHIFLAVLFIFYFSVSKADAKTDYYKIYDELSPANFEYMFGIDPFQAEDYTKYMFSPYPLLRVGVKFIFKDTVIEPGYYLLTPRKRNGQTYVLFKVNGRVSHIIPVYETDLVDPLFYEQYVPEIKKTLWQKICNKTSNFIGRTFSKSTQKMPPPRSYVEVNDIEGEFWQLILYYGTQKYYMIFRQR